MRISDIAIARDGTPPDRGRRRIARAIILAAGAVLPGQGVEP